MYPEGEMSLKVAQDCAIQVPTCTERLRQRKRDLESQLQQVNEALDALESDPKTARIVDSLSKLGHF